MRFLGVPEGLWGSFWIFEVLWYTWANEAPYVYQRVYGLLWIFEVLWYTWENKTLGVPEGLWGSLDF